MGGGVPPARTGDDGAFAISRKVANSCSLNPLQPNDRPTPRTRQARRKDLLAKKSVRFPLFTLPVRPPPRLVRQSIHLQLAKVSPAAAAVHVRSPSVSLSLSAMHSSPSLSLSPDDVTRSCSSNTHAFAVPSPDDDEISQKSADLECGDLS